MEHTRKVSKGCVVFMKRSSGLTGYGNAQCVSAVHHESLGTISLYGHNQHYKTDDIAEIIEYPCDDLLAACDKCKEFILATYGLVAWKQHFSDMEATIKKARI